MKYFITKLFHSSVRTNLIAKPIGFAVVELRGVEPLSEKAHTALSTRLLNIYLSLTFSIHGETFWQAFNLVGR